MAKNTSPQAENAPAINHIYIYKRNRISTGLVDSQDGV